MDLYVCFGVALLSSSLLFSTARPRISWLDTHTEALKLAVNPSREMERRVKDLVKDGGREHETKDHDDERCNCRKPDDDKRKDDGRRGLESWKRAAKQRESLCWARRAVDIVLSAFWSCSES